jgi:AcrR family transcriptional regulator
VTPSLTRRERLRTATVTEIKDLARRLLVAGGPPAISLRAIARDMGMTAPAIYRYFPSLDALVTELAEDLYDELRAAVAAARETATTPIGQLTDMVRAFRRWSVTHPVEFALIFGNPVPGVVRFEDGCLDPDHAAARFGAEFLEVFAEMWPVTPLPTPPADVIEAHIGPYLQPYQSQAGVDLPVEALYAYLSAWIRLYGLVAMEVFGHLQWAVSAVEPLFELELAAFLTQVQARDR